MDKTSSFDAACYLTSPELQAELLEDAFASGDAGYVEHALGVIAKARAMTAAAPGRGPRPNPTSHD